MITAVDTNILIYVLAGSAEAEAADAALAEALYAGELIISEPVYAEVAGQFDSAREVQAFFNRTGLRLVATTDIGLFAAGHAWRAYSARRRHATQCPSCGRVSRIRCRFCDASLQPRQHIVADFIIGAHAMEHADQLLTRDRGYYGRYFPRLTLATIR